MYVYMYPETGFIIVFFYMQWYFMDKLLINSGELVTYQKGGNLLCAFFLHQRQVMIILNLQFIKDHPTYYESNIRQGDKP